MAVQQVRDRSASEAENLARSKESPREDGPREGSPYSAALRATALLVPVVAVLGTLSAYVALGGASGSCCEVFESYPIAAGAFAVISGASAAIFIWLVVALPLRRFTGAGSVNRRAYDMLRERLCRLENRVEHTRLEASEPQEEIENGIRGISRYMACEHATRECEEIKRGLESGGGMPWVTGTGYVELWRRIHRAEEALIKVEPCTETLAGAMYDESRLNNSNMTNKDPLLKRLRSAVVVLDSSETSDNLQYLEEQPECSLDEKQRKKPENRAKATTILSQIRYEINSFRDNVWEGIIHARNRLADASVLLGLVTYALLALAVFAGAPHTAVLGAFAYFLVGALAGLFAQARTERTTDTAVDDFGLSTARLLNVPWLSGLAAVGGVLIASVLDGQFAAAAGSPDDGTALADIFAGGTPSLLIVAAVFGLTPDLLIRRLTQQAEKYKGDLQSTETSKSTEASQNADTGQRR